LVERMLGEASWLLSHAEALADYGREEDAAAEFARAAACEEQVACLLEAAGQERDAAIHRVSAASCHQRLGQYARAVTLVRAALSCDDLLSDHRARVEKLLVRYLANAKKELSRAAKGRRKQPSPTR
ncbi:MAG: hypothetical protein L0Z62_44085, partial [Gemmataceae bacterium]|nr:hypothetical protein [Gemmataceae bacterium]